MSIYFDVRRTNHRYKLNRLATIDILRSIRPSLVRVRVRRSLFVTGGASLIQAPHLTVSKVFYTLCWESVSRADRKDFFVEYTFSCFTFKLRIFFLLRRCERIWTSQNYDILWFSAFYSKLKKTFWEELTMFFTEQIMVAGGVRRYTKS